MRRNPTYESISIKTGYIWGASILVYLSIGFLPIEALAQQVPLIGGGAGSSNAAVQTTNEVLEFLLEYMQSIGATLAVVFFLALVILVKFGVMPKEKLKDFAVIIVAFLIAPILIPLVYNLAQ